jgi:hypothetical protein
MDQPLTEAHYLIDRVAEALVEGDDGLIRGPHLEIVEKRPDLHV